jgi:chemotaxis protein CheX
MPFEVAPQDGYALAKLSGECVGDEKPALIDLFLSSEAARAQKHVVVQCSECSSMTAAFLRQLSLLLKDVRSRNGGVRLVGANEKILAAIKAQGLDRLLINKQSLRGALVDFGLATSKQIDVNFINPFLNATQKVFKVQCQMDAQAGKADVKKATDPLLLGDISGIISISSESFSGTLAISLTERVFCKIAANMLGEPCEKISEDKVDLVGELSNIILGQAKLELTGLGYAIQMAIPSCVWGKDHKIKHFGGGACVVLPFETAEGQFFVEITTQRLVDAEGGRQIA